MEVATQVYSMRTDGEVAAQSSPSVFLLKRLQFPTSEGSDVLLAKAKETEQEELQ